jgi:hypothetical protein
MQAVADFVDAERSRTKELAVGGKGICIGPRLVWPVKWRDKKKESLYLLQKRTVSCRPN